MFPVDCKVLSLRVVRGVWVKGRVGKVATWLPRRQSRRFVAPTTARDSRFPIPDSRNTYTP